MADRRMKPDMAHDRRFLLPPIPVGRLLAILAFVVVMLGATAR